MFLDTVTGEVYKRHIVRFVFFNNSRGHEAINNVVLWVGIEDQNAPLEDIGAQTAKNEIGFSNTSFLGVHPNHFLGVKAAIKCEAFWNVGQMH